MLVKPPDCKGCVLYGNGKGFILPEGYNTKKVFIVGEAAGQQEENTGKPFVKYAQAGSKLEEIFRLSGYQRDNFKILNVVNCRPPGNKLEYTPYETPAIEHCRVHLEKEIKPNGKNIIFTLGNVPFKALTGYSGIRKESITLMRGYIYETKYGRLHLTLFMIWRKQLSYQQCLTAVVTNMSKLLLKMKDYIHIKREID
jgi:uracil-DNA glycosylase family 4